jgi:hypothetical protein
MTTKEKVATRGASASANKQKIDKTLQLASYARDLSEDNRKLKIDGKVKDKIIIMLGVLTLTFGISLVFNSYTTTHSETKYIRVGPDGTLGEIPVYSRPYLTEIDRINFAQRIVMNMSSIGWLNRERVLVDMQPLFIGSVFNRFVSTMESDKLMNRESLNKYHTSVSAAIETPGRIVDDNAKVKGVPSKYRAEKIEFGVVQEVSQNGVKVATLRSLVRVILVRQNPNETPYGYRVVSYIVKQRK